MVLAGRSQRGDGSRQRWLILGLVITSIVLIIDASIKSANPGPARRLDAQVWMDRTLAIVAQSNVGAAELAGFRTATVTDLTAATLTADLAAMTASAQTAYRRFTALREPDALHASAGLLEACLLLRSQAAAAVSSAVETSLRDTTATTASGVGRLVAAVGQLQLADQAYQLFASNLPASVGVTAPASTWVPDGGMYSATDLQVFLSALRARISLAPVHLLHIVTVGTTPPPLGATGLNGSVEVLAPSTDLTVTAIVGNLGNTDETALTVTATISESAGTASVSQPLRLAAGAVAAVTLAHLAPRLGPTITLTLTVRAPAGSPLEPVTRTIEFEMPSPTSSTTTTTAPVTTTIPGAGSTTTSTSSGG